jgi:hypothetical protein
MRNRRAREEPEYRRNREHAAQHEEEADRYKNVISSIGEIRTAIDRVADTNHARYDQTNNYEEARKKREIGTITALAVSAAVVAWGIIQSHSDTQQALRDAREVADRQHDDTLKALAKNDAAIEQTRRLADAAQDQAHIAKDTQQHQLRAYVGPIYDSFRLTTNCASPDEAVPRSGKESPIVFCHHYKNYGLTPAVSPRLCGDLSNRNVIFAINDSLPNTIKRIVTECRHDVGPPLPTNWPGEERKGFAPADKEEINKIITDPLRRGLLLFVIKYYDIFENHHTTYICRSFVYPPSPGIYSRCPIEVPKDD